MLKALLLEQVNVSQFLFGTGTGISNYEYGVFLTKFRDLFEGMGVDMDRLVLRAKRESLVDLKHPVNEDCSHPLCQGRRLKTFWTKLLDALL